MRVLDKHKAMYNCLYVGYVL